MWNIVLLIRPAQLPINLRGAQYGHNQASDVTPLLQYWIDGSDRGKQLNFLTLD